MKAKIKYLKTRKEITIEISEVLYNSDRITLFHLNGSFDSFFHGDKVEIEIQNQ